MTLQYWINVKDRLPEEGQLVLVYMPAIDFHIDIDERYSDRWSRYNYVDVTHWMPLPEPPKGEDSDNK